MKNLSASFRFQKASPLALVLICALFLSACGAGIAFSAEDAAVKSVLSDGDHLGKTDPNSVKLLQSLKAGERTFALVYFEVFSKDLNMGKAKCLYLYQMQKTRFGVWTPGSGGGGCEQQLGGQKDPPAQPVSVQGGRSGGNGPADIGYSTQSGQVFDETIKTVSVTWADGKTDQATVVNGSYLIIRDGQFDLNQVEALNAQGESVYTYQPEVAPGKK